MGLKIRAYPGFAISGKSRCAMENDGTFWQIVIFYFFGGDITICGYPPPSHVTFCHQSEVPPLPPLPGDVIFEWPLKCYISIIFDTNDCWIPVY